MRNLYTEYAISNASLSFSFSDYTKNCSSSFNGGYPSSSCCCCCCSCNCCSSIPIKTVYSSRLVPISPSPFYEFKQSALIQRAPSRRRMIGDLGPTRNYYRNSSCIRDLGFNWIQYQGMKSKSKGIGFGGYGTGMSVVEERYVLHKVGAACDDAEAIISLLTEDLGDENISVEERRKKKMSSSRKGNVSENGVDQRSKVRKERVCARELDNLEARERKEGYRMTHERKDYVKSDVSRLSKGGSSGSSYYSSSDLGDSEVIVAKHEECTGMGSEQESRKRAGGVAIKEQARQELKGQRINKNGPRDNINQSIQSESHDSSSHKDSSMKKHYNSGVGESATKVNSSDIRRSGYRFKDNRASETSDSSNKYEHLTGSSGFVDEKFTSYLNKASGGEKYVVSGGETSDSSYKYRHITDSSGSANGNTTDYLSKASGGKEHVVSSGGFCRTCGQVNSGSEAGSGYEQKSKLEAETKVASRQKESSSLIAKEAHEQDKQEHLGASNQINLRKYEDYTERVDAVESYEEKTNISRRRSKLSETQNTDMRLTSTVGQQSETRLKRQEEKSTSSQTSLKKVNEKSHQHHLVATTKTELTRKNQECIELVDMGDSNVKDTSGAQQEQEARVKSSEENVVSVSSQLAKGELFQPGMQVMSQKQPRNSSKAQSGSSQVQLDGSMIAESSSASEERLHYEQSYLTERVKETHEHVKETIKQTELRYEVQEPLREPSFIKFRIEEIDEDQDKGDLPSGPSPRLDAHPQSIEVTHGHTKETLKRTELRYEVQTPLEPGFKKETSRHPYVTTTSQVRIEVIGKPSSPLPRLDPPSQSIEVHPVYVESAEKFPSQDSCRISGGEPSIYIDPQSADASPHVDLLGSAEQMGNSCHQVSGDSVDKTKHEESTSVIEVENKLPERQLPSDERLTLEQPPEREQSTTSQSGIVKRSGRALWDVLTYGVLNTGDNVSGETNNDLNVDKMSSQATVFTNRLQSDAICELQESGKEATKSGTMDQIKDDSDLSLTVVSSSEKKAADLRRGRLQRSNQVMKERFDEWDEAYRLESEQRKIDQTFMREALEEAKKAGDMWEVPVGAVLVQDGKIIARGHNLVEDSRDSTAHAEIVCIRAASSILKTWRLSETTLYVTLEPCAMCAGAILQARIGTLVYGAPNKLLGADGSWVRLFPVSVNGEGGSESTSKSEGPVHPFHPKMTIRRGILEAECGELMQQSFKLRRNKDKKTEQRDEQRSNRKLHNPSKLLHKMHHKLHILFHL